MKSILFSTLFFLLALQSFAQEQLLQVAKQYLLAGNYEKAVITYKQLAEYNPDDVSIQQDYVSCLMALKDYKTAETVLKKLIKTSKNKSQYDYTLAKLWLAQGETKKANKIFDKLIDAVPPVEKEYRALADKFIKENLIDQAIQLYDKGKRENGANPYLFSQELALLYDKNGDGLKARESLLDLYISQPAKSEEVKATFQRMYDKPEKLEAFQKVIQERIDKDPIQVAYPDLMSWLYLQQHNYEKAFAQIKTIDLQLKEEGSRMLGFARTALREKEFNAAKLAYNEVINLGNEKPFYQLARAEILTCSKEQLRFSPSYTQVDVNNLTQLYQDFITEYPSFKLKETYREWAELEARYAHNIDKAIGLLSEITQANNVDRQFKGRCKLEQGDYELIRDNDWESTLLYSQVDKDFKQDVLGEEARFKNAKLSYYKGDFVWAQGQLDVLKASTSELIANDALNLSVLITENNPVKDSDATPLLMFAKADLLEFQNKNDDCLALLDSIENQFPKHPLIDNILMERARISIKKQDYSEAALHLQKVATQYADDVLADDALFQLAGINENIFKNKDDAKRFYEEIIVKYPGSTYVSEARKNFRRLRGDKPDVEVPKAF